jgi:hypothetical protein
MRWCSTTLGSEAIRGIRVPSRVELGANSCYSSNIEANKE